jgi:hypothetical protein
LEGQYLIDTKECERLKKAFKEAEREDVEWIHLAENGCECYFTERTRSSTSAEYTRWFKYDRDYLCVNKSQFVPVIFEPPCTSLLVVVVGGLYLDQPRRMLAAQNNLFEVSSYFILLREFFNSLIRKGKQTFNDS